jgi:PKD repeat protein
MVWYKNITTWVFALALLTYGCQDAGNEGRKPIDPPTANFSSTNTNCRAPCQVDFQSLSQNADSYLWTFGDGDTSSKENPSHVFESEGIYSVSFQAKNFKGTDVVIKKIKIDSGFSKAGIESITINDFPDTDTNNTSWDPNSPPDLYVEFLQEPDSLLIGNTQVFPNLVDSITLPKTWNFNSPLVELTDFDKSYTVRFIDQDSNMPNDTVLSYTLPDNGLKAVPDPYLEEFPIKNSEDETIGNIALDWRK